MLLNGAFSPLAGFMGKADFDAVCERMRLASGVLWPIPITLDVTEEVASRVAPGGKLALRDPEGEMLAVLHVEDAWQIDRERKAQAVYGTLDRTHPGVRHLYERVNDIALGGRIEGLKAPAHHDFVALRHTPAELRERFRRLGWERVVAFQTRNPLHRAHVELTLRAAREVEANLLIQPVVGMTKPGDVDHYTRVRCYQAVLPRYPQHSVMLSLLPLAMRMGGPREALLHAIIRKNYGCTHFIVGRDHAGPGKGADGRPFYDPYAAQELVRKHEAELGIGLVPFQEMMYVESQDAYRTADEVPAGETPLVLSGSEPARALGARARDSDLVHVSRGGGRAAPHESTAFRPGLHGVLHWALGRGQIDDRRCADDQAARDRRPAGDASRRRHRPQALVLGAGLQRQGSQHQYPAHRLRRVRDHQERWHRDLRSHRPL
jgi:sulfate adenylyltransferase